MAKTTDTPVPLSVVVITYNEEKNLPRCLEAVSDIADEIFILDSFSTDSTRKIGEAFGARVDQHVFENTPAQRERNIRGAINDWVLCLDADEVVTPELKASIQRVLKDPDAFCYRINRLSCIGHQWIRHSKWYPDRKLRLFHRDYITVVGSLPHDEIKSKAGVSIKNLDGDLLHFSYTDSADRFRKVVKYGLVAGESLFEKGKRGSWWRMLIKPGFRFFNTYFLRLGFLDGFYGLVIARTEAYYAFVRESRLYELSRRRK